MMLFWANVYTFAALYLLLVKGQATQTVVVGLQGSFFTPDTISAQINETIVFEFVGDIHSVTQSSFENPCSPLPGGFDSGLAGNHANSSAPTPSWSLVITDVSNPIWFFCEATRPASHCASGMVGVINPPSIAMFEQFVSAAKLVVGTPAPHPTVILTGQGAFATNSPVAPSVSITSSPPLTTSSTSSTSTSSATTSNSPSPTGTAGSSTSSHLGAIVGGSVGGVVALFSLILAIFLVRRRKKKSPTSPADEFFRYNPVAVRRPSERAGDLHHNTSYTSFTSNNTAQFSPVRPYTQSSGPVILQPPNLHRQGSALSDANSLATTRQNFADPPSNVNIRALAQEVAAVLYQNHPTPPAHHKDSSHDLRGEDPMTTQYLNRDYSDYTDTDTSQTTQPPPNYRATPGTSPVSRGLGKPRNTAQTQLHTINDISREEM